MRSNVCEQNSGREICNSNTDADNDTGIDTITNKPNKDALVQFSHNSLIQLVGWGFVPTIHSHANQI